MPPKTQVNSATGIMGVSGSGKSSLAATLAKYIHRRWGKVLLYYNADGGGFPSEVQACIAVGIVRVFRMRTRDPGDLGLSFETCQRACQGWWPKRIHPATGEVSPGVEMVPPVSIRFEMRCSQGHLVKVVPSEALLVPTFCGACKRPVTKADMQVRKTVAPTRGFEDVGGVFYDGLSSMLAWELMEMGHRAGKLELRGEEGSIGGKVVSGDLKFGGTTRSHVGFVQARGEELVHLTLGIPNLVVPPLFTMLTHEDVDERSLSILGPKISGRAKTDEAPQWFGNMLEAAKIPAETGAGTQRTLHLSEFTDARGVRHLCKHRGSPGTMPDRLQDPADGETNPALAFTQFNLGVFFEMLDGALERRIGEVMTEFPNAPGVPDGIVEIGDSSIEVGTAVAPPPPVQAGPTTLSAPPPAMTTVPAPVAPAAPVTAAPAAPALTATAPAPRRRRGSAATPQTPPTATPVQQAAPVPPPAPEPPAAPAPPVQAAPNGPRPTPRAAAPPAGRRPAPAPGGTPAGVTVSGPTAPRAPAAAPRPPAAAPQLAAKPS